MDTSFINQLTFELEYFTNKKGIILYSPASEGAITIAERILGCNFSPQMWLFFKKYSGGRILEVNIQGIQSTGLRKIPKGIDIIESNQFLRTFNNWNPSWLHIGEDGFGNYYVVDLIKRSESGEYPVIFVDHEAIGKKEFVYQYASSYSEFLIKVVGDMKQLYTPDGELKK